MRVSRFYTGQPLAAGQVARLDERTSHHMVRVLKVRSGDRVVLFNGDGFDYAGELSAIDGRNALVAVDARLPAAPEAPIEVTLVQSISRGERMDHSLQKSTELGVAAIQPVFSERVEVRLQGARLDKRMEHWRAVIRSASEQCGRARVPVLSPPLDLAAWVAKDFHGSKLLLDPRGEDRLSGWSPDGEGLQLLVGPEGGFSEQEYASLTASGVVAVRLGPRILRTETAGPAALAVVQALAGDF